jgi:hypothetical protein
MEVNERSAAEDLLDGADAISEFLYGTKKKRRKVYHLAQIGAIPTFKLGGLCARKSALNAHLERLEKERAA